MTAALPVRIEIQVLADGVPVPGSLADVSLSMLSKNPHTMVLGPADYAGRIVASQADLLARARRNCSNFVMDYSDLKSHFGGLVEVTPATPSRIIEMEQAYERFSPHFEYPADWPTVLKAAKQWFADHAVRVLVAQVRVVPFEIRVISTEVRL